VMPQTRTAYRWRTCDLASLPDTSWLRYEIIDGELIVSTRPHLQHSEIIVRLGTLLHLVVRAYGGKVLAEPGLVWGEEAEDNVVPDVAVVLPDRVHLTIGRALSGTPNIAIAIVSDALLTVLKKIDFDLSMLRVASRRHIFEAHVNGFTLVLQVHGAKPFDDLAQQASVRLG